MALNVQKILSLVVRAVKVFNSARSNGSNNSTTTRRTSNAPSRVPQAHGNSNDRSDVPGSGYPGDFRGTVHYEYNPSLDGEADPGEVVWGWVPYEEDPSQGKDRPVLIIGRDGNWLLGLMLTSKDKNNDGRSNPDYLDIGTGSWDRERRPSEVKLDRIIRLAQSAVRREGAILDEQRFRNVVNALNNGR
ncbi:type II toxin-antitoxin system PemK/MazF family toxin [Glutamicibacter arilaitensis]|uniref:type II toxin-antitoxin system PemK/MazF family toxin n=1 Tax=Glutamicibacter arilaitensis TaxID=256701 RepID=UPI00384F0FD6